MKDFILHENVTVGENGHLFFAGRDTVSLAEKYGTPLIVCDEKRIRAKLREYKDAMGTYFSAASMPCFASKAMSFKEMYRIVGSEGVGTDIVSPGELYTAKTAGFPMEKAYFHGNNKTDEDIEFAIESGIGYFVVDNKEELLAVNDAAGRHGIRQKILLRITPGIDPHTHKKISTGGVDSKFGSAIETGLAEEMVGLAIGLENVELLGYHCHVGSQIFDIDPFTLAADIMIKFIADMRDKLGYTASVLNLGGGFGVRYIESDPCISITENIKNIGSHIDIAKKQYGIDNLDILMEPGRSIVADACLTLYTVGSLKEIKGFKNYVSIDGGMTDNPRYALYQSDYTVLSATEPMGEKVLSCTIGGRCCESGDLIQENVMLPRMKRGDILAVLVTGAYNYSMASNYNRVGRPAVLMLGDGREDFVCVRRETFEDIVSCDV